MVVFLVGKKSTVPSSSAFQSSPGAVSRKGFVGNTSVDGRKPLYSCHLAAVKLTPNFFMTAEMPLFTFSSCLVCFDHCRLRREELGGESIGPHFDPFGLIISVLIEGIFFIHAEPVEILVAVPEQVAEFVGHRHSGVPKRLY